MVNQISLIAFAGSICVALRAGTYIPATISRARIPTVQAMLTRAAYRLPDTHSLSISVCESQ